MTTRRQEAQVQWFTPTVTTVTRTVSEGTCSARFLLPFLSFVSLCLFEQTPEKAAGPSERNTAAFRVILSGAPLRDLSAILLGVSVQLDLSPCIHTCVCETESARARVRALASERASERERAGA